MSKKTVGTEPMGDVKCLPETESFRRSSRYNYEVMEKDVLENKVLFAGNLSMLRTKRGISAREMSLSLGQGASYINDIENGRTMPSMGMFFEICEYLKVSPYEFFAYTYRGEGNGDAFEGLLEEDRKVLAQLIERLRIKK